MSAPDFTPEQLASLQRIEAAEPAPESYIGSDGLTNDERRKWMPRLGNGRRAPEPYEPSVGDRDQTTFGQLNFSAGSCGDLSGGWVCTMLAGHDGIHVAGDGDEVCAVWDK